MPGLTDQQVDVIAQRVLQRLSTATGQSNGSHQPAARTTAPAPSEQSGTFATVDQAIQAATQAFYEFQSRSLADRGEIIASIRECMLASAECLAREAHAETGLGRWQDKVIKNELVARKTGGTEDLTPAAITGDRGLTLTEWAPFGVVASITPCTNPTSTIICNTIGMLAAGNTVVFNVHPSAKKVSVRNIALLNDAIIKAGGPPNLVTTLAEPTVESAQTLMKHPGIRLLVVTGGPGVVDVAMKSGKRAICAGPGNPPVVVDETADIAQAARDTVRGASFDNNVICVDEKEAFVVESVADEFLRAAKSHGAVVLNTSQTRQLENLVIERRREPPESSVVRRDLIGKNAGVILGHIGISAGDDVRLAIVEVDPQAPIGLVGTTDAGLPGGPGGKR